MWAFEINLLNNLVINGSIQRRLREGIEKDKRVHLLSEKLYNTVSMSNKCMNLGYASCQRIIKATRSKIENYYSNNEFNQYE